jgi:hypothetical protein
MTQEEAEKLTALWFKFEGRSAAFSERMMISAATMLMSNEL